MLGLSDLAELDPTVAKSMQVTIVFRLDDSACVAGPERFFLELFSFTIDITLSLYEYISSVPVIYNYK